MRGDHITFHAGSLQATGSRNTKNDYLAYEVKATAEVNGTAQTKSVQLEQDDIDTLRQEYIDANVTWLPGRATFTASYTHGSTLNKGPYDSIPAETAGAMTSMVNYMTNKINELVSGLVRP